MNNYNNKRHDYRQQLMILNEKVGVRHIRLNKRLET